MSGEPGPLAESVGYIAYQFSLVQPLLPTYAHLIISALFPIFAGSHASLSRPSSAAAPKEKSKKSKSSEYEDEDTEEEEDVQRMEGLSPSDAIIFPLLAGCTLAALYFLIKWLNDPELLNRILNAYFAIFAVFSVSGLVTGSLDYLHSMVFPRRYADEGVIWHVHEKAKRATALAGSSAAHPPRPSPLPGTFSKLPLPSFLSPKLWWLRSLPNRKWTVKIHLHKVGALKVRIGSHGLIGAIAGLSTVIYFNFVSKPWFLTNLMGFGFSYNALQLMSPTTFATGSLILGSLFLYDIYFVFFTPMMVTVAKSLDIPIKLVFPRPDAEDPTLTTHAMLGLGDIVLPGIMIALALRFDLYLFYLRKQKAIASDSSTPPQVIKAKYKSVSNRWGEHFWTHSWFGYPLVSPKDDVPHPATTFPKPYFHAALTGYVLGMVATVVVMQVFDHAQPALLYLVPGVLSSVWGTAFIRGDIKEMWNYSEVTEDDDSPHGQEGKDKKKHSNQSFFSHDKQMRNAAILERRMKGIVDDGVAAEEDDDRDEDVSDSVKDAQKAQRILSHSRSREFFSFSIEAPFKLKQPGHPTSSGDKMGSSGGSGEVLITPADSKETPRSTTVDSKGQPKEKRARVE